MSEITCGFSVLMSVYERESPDCLYSSLQSIEQQTLQPSELVLVEDGPLGQELSKVIDEFRNKLHIVSIKIPVNQGLASALNEGLNYCSHELVARMDSDDICFLDRFEKQVKFMIHNPEISFSSGFIEEYDDQMVNVLNVRTLPLDHEALRQFAKSRSPMSHATTIYRKSAVSHVGGYPKMYPEDYALWVLMIANGFKMANLPDFLLKVRAGDAMISRRGVRFLKGYVQTYYLMLKLGLINPLEFILNVSKQSALRLAPAFVRKLLYKYARS